MSEHVSPLREAMLSEAREILGTVFERLSERQQAVVCLHYGLFGKPQCTLHEIGQLLNLSRERVRQIEAKAIRQLNTPKTTETLRAILDVFEDDGVPVLQGMADPLHQWANLNVIYGLDGVASACKVSPGTAGNWIRSGMPVSVVRPGACPAYAITWEHLVGWLREKTESTPARYGWGYVRALHTLLARRNMP